MRTLAWAGLAGLPLAAAPTAGADPWSTAAVALYTLFTGVIVRALSGVAVVLAGLMYAFSTHQDKGKIAALIFGLGMALGAVQFLNWITGTTVTATIDAGIPPAICADPPVSETAAEVDIAYGDDIESGAEIASGDDIESGIEIAAGDDGEAAEDCLQGAAGR